MSWSLGYFLNKFFDEKPLNFYDFCIAKVFIVLDLKIELNLLRQYFLGVDVHVLKHSCQFQVYFLLLSVYLLFFSGGMIAFWRLDCSRSRWDSLSGLGDFGEWWRGLTGVQFLLWLVLDAHVATWNLLVICQLLLGVHSALDVWLGHTIAQFLVVVCRLF